jgi:hypothetical protein
MYKKGPVSSAIKNRIKNLISKNDKLSKFDF